VWRCSAVTKMQTTATTRNAKFGGGCSVDGWRISFVRRAIEDRNRVTYLGPGRFIVRLPPPPSPRIHPFWIFIANPAGRIYLAENSPGVLIILDPEQLFDSKAFISIYYSYIIGVSVRVRAASVPEKKRNTVLGTREHDKPIVKSSLLDREKRRVMGGRG